MAFTSIYPWLRQSSDSLASLAKSLHLVNPSLTMRERTWGTLETGLGTSESQQAPLLEVLGSETGGNHRRPHTLFPHQVWILHQIYRKISHYYKSSSVTRVTSTYCQSHQFNANIDVTTWLKTLSHICIVHEDDTCCCLEMNHKEDNIKDMQIFDFS